IGQEGHALVQGAPGHGAGDGKRLGRAPAVQGEGGGDLECAAVGQEEGGAVAGLDREDLLQEAAGQLSGRSRRLESRGDLEQHLEIPSLQPLFRRPARGPLNRGAGGEGALVGQDPWLAAGGLSLAGLEEEEHLSHGHEVALPQAVLVDRPAVDEGALAAPEVTDEEAAVRGVEPAVVPRCGEIQHPQGVGGMAPDGEGLRIQREGLAGQWTAQHDEFWGQRFSATKRYSVSELIQVRTAGLPLSPRRRRAGTRRALATSRSPKPHSSRKKGETMSVPIFRTINVSYNGEGIPLVLDPPEIELESGDHILWDFHNVPAG